MTTKTIPADAKRIKLQPLAYGESTGHNHRLVSHGGLAVEDACEMYELQEGEAKRHFLRVTAEGVSLIHADGLSEVTADHHPHVVLPGEYEVVIQKEETDWGRAQVID